MQVQLFGPGFGSQGLVKICSRYLWAQPKAWAEAVMACPRTVTSARPARRESLVLISAPRSRARVCPCRWPHWSVAGIGPVCSLLEAPSSWAACPGRPRRASSNCLARCWARRPAERCPACAQAAAIRAWSWAARDKAQTLHLILQHMLVDIGPAVGHHPQGRRIKKSKFCLLRLRAVYCACLAEKTTVASRTKCIQKMDSSIGLFNAFTLKGPPL